MPRPGAQILNPEVLSQIRAVDAIPERFGGRVAWSKLDPNHGLELQLNWPKLWIRLGPAVDLQQKLRAAALVLRAYPLARRASGTELRRRLRAGAPGRDAGDAGSCDDGARAVRHGGGRHQRHDQRRQRDERRRDCLASANP